ncbi:hypothetical protein KVR01_003827 [Diaporthe batatas]|uniref:uncharacterized protein n=1 Tax=Diaporthe batatas TaxID=748121 RepID=UPI001D052639|nr:uncharacterized protein KVR01_003827 [Diaporthe batatas]KAG8168138.1 hypothetical protein KVR01_003827 [Diaporthe batatas]
MLQTSQSQSNMSQTLSQNGAARMRYPEMSAKDDIIQALIVAAAQQYAPSASSPLNPTCCGDKGLRRQSCRSTRLRPVRRKTSETPTERLLRRKAAIAYERTTACSLPPPKDASSTVICTKICDSSAKGSSLAITTVETTPESNTEAATMFRVVKVGDVRHGWLSDVERQAASDFSLLQQNSSARHRLQIALILSLLSVCSTFLTIVGLDSLRGHYLARQI